jgi:hypothetical protein
MTRRQSVHDPFEKRNSRLKSDPELPMEPDATTVPNGSMTTGRLGLLRECLQHRPAMVNGSELVARSLAALGFQWIAGVDGTPVYGIFRA